MADKSEQTFVKTHKGRFAIRHAGILVRRAFDTAQEAKKWALWNYSSVRVWKLQRL